MDRNEHDLCIYSKHVFIFPDGGPALKAQGLLAALFVSCSLALKSFQWSRRSRDDLDIYDTPLLKPLFDLLDTPISRFVFSLWSFRCGHKITGLYINTCTQTYRILLLCRPIDSKSVHSSFFLQKSSWNNNFRFIYLQCFCCVFTIFFINSLNNCDWSCA